MKFEKFNVTVNVKYFSIRSFKVVVFYRRRKQFCSIYNFKLFSNFRYSSYIFVQESYENSAFLILFCFFCQKSRIIDSF